MSSPVNIIKVDLLQEKINELNIVIKVVKSILNYNPQNKDEEILLMYIEIQNMSCVAEIINEKGYRLKSIDRSNERRYMHQDISHLIDDNSGHVNKTISEFAKALYKFNKGKVSWNSIVKLCRETKKIGNVF